MTRIEDQVVSAIEREELLALLTQLVRVPSPVGSEGPLAETIGEWLRAHDLEVDYQTVEGDRKNVIGSVQFPQEGPCLMFNGHLDTVAASSHSERDPFRATRIDGRVYGLGALDMKGGIAASLIAIKAILSAKSCMRGKIIFSGVIDEEGYSSGARALLKRGLDEVDAVIIGEPCGLPEFSPIPTMTAGKVLYRLLVQGVQAHGFSPSDGINAVEEAAKVVASLGQLRQTRHEGLGVGPVSTLKMSGGYEEYAVVVPDHCEVIISRMIVPGESREQCKKDLEALIESLDLKAQTSVEMPPPYYPPLIVDKTFRLFEQFDRAHHCEYGYPPYYGPSTVITDASVFSGEGGIPTLVFGPSGGGIHQAGEYVNVDSLVACSRTFARTALAFLGTVET